jgi:hypothetical protein
MNPTDSTEPGLSRRTLLRSGIGAALVSVMEHGDAAPAPDERAGPRRTGRTDADDTDDALSVRAAAEWMDREHTPRRLRGNGPPFADRPDLSPFSKHRYDGKNMMFHPGFFDDVSYDLGMAYRTDDEKIDEEIDQHLTEKGLVESHAGPKARSGARCGTPWSATNEGCGCACCC